MKKLLCAVFLVSILLTGCGNDTQKEMTETAQAVENASVEEIYNTISSLSQTKMVVLNDKLIENYYGIQPADFDEYVFAQAENPKSAEMIIIAKAKDGVDISTYMNNINNVLEQKTDEMVNYNEPEQAELIENSKHKFSDKALYIVVSPEADTMAKTIENSLGL